MDLVQLASVLITVSLIVSGVLLYFNFLTAQYERDIGNLKRVALAIKGELMRKQQEENIARYKDPLFRPVISVMPLYDDEEPRTDNERRILRMLAEGQLVTLETATKHLRPGMVLARTVNDAGGAPLVRRGAELTTKIISKLTELDVDSAWILYDPNKLRGASPAAAGTAA